MDQLTLKSLRYQAGHGYYENEREKGNVFEVDLVLGLDLRTAGKQDKLAETVNYEEAERIVREVMEGPALKLIETLTSRIGNTLFREFEKLTTLEVRVRKLNPPLKTAANYSEVTMKWQR